MQGAAKKTASHTPVSTQEKKVRVCDDNARARSHFVDVSVRWSSGYVRRNDAEGHGFEPRRVQWNFLPGTLSRRGDQFDSGECTKKIQLFRIFAYVHAWPETP